LRFIFAMIPFCLATDRVANYNFANKKAQFCDYSNDEVSKRMRDGQVLSGQTPTLLGSEQLLDLVADKWTIRIIHAVRDGHRRFGQMRRFIPAITRRMLTLRLREMERNGLLTRTDYGENPPRVEYAFTSIGTSLVIHLTALCQWSEANLDHIEQARRDYDLRQADERS
jgi:DNA-binding HxlR family transcriptional regulator